MKFNEKELDKSLDILFTDIKIEIVKKEENNSSFLEKYKIPQQSYFGGIDFAINRPELDALREMFMVGYSTPPFYLLYPKPKEKLYIRIINRFKKLFKIRRKNG